MEADIFNYVLLDKVSLEPRDVVHLFHKGLLANKSEKCENTFYFERNIAQLLAVWQGVKMPKPFKKKSFDSCKRYLFTSIKSSLKYINYGKKGALTIFDMGKAGLNCTGSKNLQAVFHKYKAEFEEAAKLDEKSLKNERQEAAPPPPVTQNSAFSHILTQQSSKVKKLEQHLPIMETKQV